jgi:hypothetical protein
MGKRTVTRSNITEATYFVIGCPMSRSVVSLRPQWVMGSDAGS